jgi:hypothetical protein
MRLGVVVATLLLCACAGGGMPDPRPEPGTAPVERDHAPTAAPTLATLPTAVRVPAIDPDDVVLRPADLPDAFTLVHEFAIDRVEVSRPREEPRTGVASNPRNPAGSGRHVVLVRGTRSTARNVVSVSTIVVRYETSVLAAAGFVRSERSRPVAREHWLAPDHDALGDEVRAWQYGYGGAIVDEVLFRSRNYVLAVTVVATARANGTMPALRYAQHLRSRLST